VAESSSSLTKGARASPKKSLRTEKKEAEDTDHINNIWPALLLLAVLVLCCLSACCKQSSGKARSPHPSAVTPVEYTKAPLLPSDKQSVTTSLLPQREESPLLSPRHDEASPLVAPDQADKAHIDNTLAEPEEATPLVAPDKADKAHTDNTLAEPMEASSTEQVNLPASPSPTEHPKTDGHPPGQEGRTTGDETAVHRPTDETAAHQVPASAKEHRKIGRVGEAPKGSSRCCCVGRDSS